MQAIIDSEYPKLQLENGEVQTSIYLPDPVRGYYRGTRFGWSGIIEHVDTANHHFYAPLHAKHNPEGHDFVSGPAEEFAMFDPMGFVEAEAGESFVKIGVGLLMNGEKSDYRFDGERGWAYRYWKVIRLLPGLPELSIEHRLENTGEKDIDVNNYNHNFTLIDGVPYGLDYRVEFPFTTADPMPINDLAWFRANAIEVEKPLGEKSLWIPLFEGDGPASYNAALIRNLRTGATVEFRGDAPITRMVFWAVERAVCPEPFISLSLAPGHAQEWSSCYRFSGGDTLDSLSEKASP